MLSQGGSTVSVAQIETAITAKNLEICVQHLQALLEDIETLQQTISTAEDATTPSAYHQTLVGSYFRARGHLDSVLLGNPQSSDDQSSSDLSTKRTSADREVQRTLTGSTVATAETNISGTSKSTAATKGRFITDADINRITEEATERGRKEERAKLALEFEKKELEARLKAEELKGARAKSDDEGMRLAQEERMVAELMAAKAAHEQQSVEIRKEATLKEDASVTDSKRTENPETEKIPQWAQEAFPTINEDAFENVRQGEVMGPPEVNSDFAPPSRRVDVEPQTQLPVEFRDAIGRKFRFPYHMCNTWQVSYTILYNPYNDCYALFHARSGSG